jgi:hypothetical protein
MALIQSSQIQFPLSGSFSGSFYGDGSGLTGISASIGDVSRIVSGRVTASVENNIFLITSASVEVLKISNNTSTFISDVFLIKNTLNQPTFKVSESIVYFATQSSELTTPAIAGGMYFTSTSFYVGLES